MFLISKIQENCFFLYIFKNMFLKIVKAIKNFFLKKLNVWLATFIKVKVWSVDYQKKDNIYIREFFFFFMKSTGRFGSTFTSHVRVLPFLFLFLHAFQEVRGYCSWTVALNVEFSSVNSASVHCSWIHKYHFLIIFSLKMNLTVLFIYLKIILLQYFQFSISAK